MQHALHLRRAPFALTSRSRDAALIQARCDSPQPKQLLAGELRAALVLDIPGGDLQAALGGEGFELIAGAAGLSGNPDLVEGVGRLEALGAEAGVDGCAAGPTKATGCANADGDAVAGTAALLTGALWRPAE